MSKTAADPVVIVIAAGASRRFGPDDKLLADLDGRPLIARALDAYAALPAARKIAVTRPDSKCPDICAAAGFAIIENPRADDGMGTSIAAGVAAASDAAFALIGLADMPHINPQTPPALWQAAGSENDIIVPLHEGRRGHPVLFGRAHFAALAALDGDSGGRAVIAAAEPVTELPVDDPGIHQDIDTLQDLAALGQSR